jgi:FAD/FMN-containing dehydrogenase
MLMTNREGDDMTTAPTLVLPQGFSGDVIAPGGTGYEDAGRTLFASGSPRFVLRPRSTSDVQAAIRLATGAGLPVSIRGGGHSFPGFGTNDDGIVIDLRHLDDIEVLDPARHVVRVGGGATWGQVAAALAEHGLGFSSGDTRSVGVGGLTLSGGMGWKVRKHGLALDNLVGAEVVTADGVVRHATADEEPNLFWALRGGGGNIGVVTAFELVAHPTTAVFHGRITFPAAESDQVLQGWATYLRSASEDLTSIVALANPVAGGPDAPVEVHVVVDTDDDARAAEILAPIHGLGTVLEDDVVLKPYADTLVDGAMPPPGLQFLCRNAFVDHASVPDVLRILSDATRSDGTTAVAVRSLGGAVARVDADATAYAHRQAELMVVTLAAGPEPVVQAARPGLDRLWARLAPHVTGAYANFLTGATDDDVAAVYPEETRCWLAAVKRRYDPANLFAGNHTVRPGVR